MSMNPLPTAHIGDFETAPQNQDIVGLTVGAYHDAMDFARKQYLQGQQDQDRETARDQQDTAFQHQQKNWQNQDEDRQYGISQRPLQQQMNNALLAQRQANLGVTNANIANTTVKFQTLSADAAMKQHAIDYVNAAAMGQNMMPGQGQITSYGYQGDETPDNNSSYGIGAFVGDDEADQIKSGKNTPNKLQPGDIGLSPDTRAAAEAAGIKPMEPMMLHFSDGTTHIGRYADHTQSDLTGRYDIYSPDGPDQRNGKKILGFSKVNAGLPSADQLDRMMQVASTTKDPDIIARAQQINEANSLRPEIQAQRNGKMWAAGQSQFFNRLASLPDQDVATAVARMSGINLANSASLPPQNQPGMWDDINQAQQKAIANYNSDPATFRRVQLQGQPRVPILPKANQLTPSSLSHLITSENTPKEIKDAAQDAYARIISTYMQNNEATPAANGPAAPVPASPTAKPPGSSSAPKGSISPDLQKRAQDLMSSFAH